MYGNVWPSFIGAAPIAIALLRVCAGALFVYIGAKMAEHEDSFTRISLPFVSEPSRSMVRISAFITACIGFALVMGFFTQLAALFGFFIGIKHIYFSRFYPYLFPLSLSTYILLTAISVTIVICGAGAFAFDFAFAQNV